MLIFLLKLGVDFGFLLLFGVFITKCSKIVVAQNLVITKEISASYCFDGELNMSSGNSHKRNRFPYKKQKKRLFLILGVFKRLENI